MNSTPTGDSAPDTVQYGVTSRGFVAKPFQALLDEASARAQLVFGPDIDLRSSSTLRKLLEITSLEDALLWMRLDGVYNAGFVTTASGDALDLLGMGLGLDRANLPAAGQASLTLTDAAPSGCLFTLPPGTLVETAPAAPVQRFRLLAAARLIKHDPPDGSEKASATVEAVTSGAGGNLPANQLARITPTFAARYLSFDPALIKVSNPEPFSGGDLAEDDTAYRRRLYALPRTLWTPEAVRAVVLALDGVRDAVVSDPYGGLDPAAPPFGESCFGDNTFQALRDLCNPYFFTVTVAPRPGVLWEGDGEVEGLREQILAALQPIRPVSIFPSLELADVVEVAMHAILVTAAGTDPGGLLAAVRAALAVYVGSLGLGDAVLYSQVLRVLADTPGITDVRDLRLRRCPPRFGEIVYGPPARFGGDDIARIEAGCGDDLSLAAREVAVLAADSPLLDLQVVTG